MISGKLTLLRKEGNEESGHHGHRGRIGIVGGSLPGVGGRRGMPPIETIAIEEGWAYNNANIHQLAQDAIDLRKAIKRMRYQRYQRYTYRGYTHDDANAMIRDDPEIARLRADLARTRTQLEHDLTLLSRPVRQEEPSPQIELRPVQVEEPQNKMVVFMQDWQSIPENPVYADYYSNVEDATLQKYGMTKNDITKMGYLKDMDTKYVVRVGGDDKLMVEMRITDPNNYGRDVATIQYDYSSDKDVFHADFMRIEDNYQDRNHGSTLAIRHTMQAKMAGYKYMEFNADLSIGKYAWAKEGADFQSPGRIDYAKQRLTGWFTSKFPSIARQNKTKLLAALDTLHTAHDIAVFKIPGLTLTGRQIYNNMVPRDMVLELGKAFMLDSDGLGDWYARVDLSTVGGF